MNIYEQIDTIFSGEAEERPQWAGKILEELKEVKVLLQEQRELLKNQPTQVHTSYPQNRQKIDREYYNFIKQFRISMKADTKNNNYPTFEYNGRKLGVAFSGLLYDKKDSKTLSRKEAFRVYRYAYEHKDESKISA
jgi:hypothetical protein